MELLPCGTTAAYKRHLRKGEPACPACLEANNNKSKLRRTNPESAKEDYQRNNARLRALWRLSHEYPERFRQLCIEELTKLTFPEEK